MKNITFSADEETIERAREVARSRRKTLNEMFREWLEDIVDRNSSAKEFDSLMKRLKYVNAGRKFTREEMNER
jgi:predicted transcriptional regulator